MRRDRRLRVAFVVGCAVLFALPAGAATVRKTGPTARPPGEIARLIRLGLPVYCGGRHGRDVALTFDDGPGVYTNLAIRVLRRVHARATFFLVGKSIERFPTLPRREAGVAAFGDHTWTHRFLPGLTRSAIHHEIAATKALVEHTTGRPVWLFRPPYAARSRVVDAEVRAAGLVDILWDVDSRDWVPGTFWTQVGKIVVAGLRPGAIVSMHENHGQTIRALRYVILPAIRRLHLRPVTIPTLLRQDPPTLGELRAGYAGCSTAPRPHGAG